MKKSERALRQDIIDQCLFMNASGLNQGTAGNVSARFENRVLVTPTGVAYDQLTVEDLAALPIEGNGEDWEGPLQPSSEWRFHLRIHQARPEVGAVVHTHSTFATALAITGREIPACHYMVAAGGGATVRCADYATFGTEALSHNILKALEDRRCCLIANHGMLAVGETLREAMWLACELETLAKQYYLSLAIGGPVVLSDGEIEDVLQAFRNYGPKARESDDDREVEESEARAKALSG